MSLRQQIMQDSPAGYWPLDETSGTTAFDRSGNGRNGTYTGAVTLNARDVLPGAKGPDFAGGYVSLGDLAAWSSHAGASGVITLEAFVLGDSYAGGNETILSKRVMGSYEWTLYGNLAGIMEAATGPMVASIFSGGLVVGRLHHVAYTYNRATPLSILYLDGVELARQTSFSGNSSDTGASARIGGAGVDTAPFDGGIAHAAIFPTALSAARIKAHYEAGIRGGVAF